MNAAGQTLCLNMIVKNEAPVIRRCIDSVRPIIDSWVIVDTGSTDGTQDIIREYLHDLPGELYERPWRDFAYNRSEALELARGKSNYTLIIDADDTLAIAPNSILPVLDADSYKFMIDDAAIVYHRVQLVRSAMPWRYEGVLHEYLTCDGAGPSGQLPAIRLRRNHDGARRKDPQTYRRDAGVLELALRTESNPFLLARYRFYLAQSYRDCGERLRALEHYLVRAELGFWQEEVFISLYCAAQLKEQLGHPEGDVIAAYLRAADALSTRAEALHGASRFCRQKKRHEEGYEIAKRGLEIPMPSSDALFVEPSVYETGLLDEYAINAYWSGHNRDCLDASLKMLGGGRLSAVDTRRVVANARFASARLPKEPNLGSLRSEDFVKQHALAPQRPRYSRSAGAPRVLVAILANGNEEELPLYLSCIESLDYPKSSIVLYIRTYNNPDGTERLLREWTDQVGSLYAGVEFDAADVGTREPFNGRDGDGTPLRVPGHIRQHSLSRALVHACDFYFVANVGNFIRRCTLRDLVALDLPIVAPFLRSVGADDLYANYHADIDSNGYYAECDQYAWVLNRWIRGVLEMPVVNCTYLIRTDIIGGLAYEDGTPRHEYVVFSESARKQGTPQYLDTRQVYGYVAFGEDHRPVADVIERARELLRDDAELGRLDIECAAASSLVYEDGDGTRRHITTRKQINPPASPLRGPPQQKLDRASHPDPS